MTFYKAYDHGLTCRGKQYEVGETYTEDKAEICECGMHYCDNPADLMYYHDLIDSDGEIMEVTEVEDLAQESTQSEENACYKKYCTTKLKIGAKVSFKDWVKATVDFVFEKCKGEDGKTVSNEYNSQLAASGDSSQLAASGDSSRLAASGGVLTACGIGELLTACGIGVLLTACGERGRLRYS